MKEFFKIRSKKANRARIQVITIAVSLMLVAAIAIGGTVAWLVDTTKPVTNTFTFGDINITLKETNVEVGEPELDADTTAKANTYEGLVPGQTQKKDPTVIVKANSVPCYLFVKITENNNVIGSDKIIKWDINEGWTALSGATNVYYVTVDKTTADQLFPVLKGNQVNVNSNVTKTMINSLTVNDTYPTLAFTAYAIQEDNLTDHNGDYKVDATDAWALLDAQINTP